MSYNTSHAKYKSTYLDAYDCTVGGPIKGRRLAQSTTRYFATFTVGAGAIEVGQCIAMLRIPAGTTVAGGRLSWNLTGSAQIAFGDPYACARLVGSCFTCLPSDLVASPGSPGQGLDCGVIRKISVTGIGDGCGIGYTYTCETDLVVTNLYAESNATVGGWVGSNPANSGTAGAAITAGTITVVLDVLPT